MKRLFLLLAASLIFFAGCEKNDPEQVAGENEWDTALPGIFTVNAQGKKVRFSKGNLWYGKVEGARTATFNFEDKPVRFLSIWGL